MHNHSHAQFGLTDLRAFDPELNCGWKPSIPSPRCIADWNTARRFLPHHTGSMMRLWCTLLGTWSSCDKPSDVSKFYLERRSESTPHTEPSPQRSIVKGVPDTHKRML